MDFCGGRLGGCYPEDVGMKSKTCNERAADVVEMGEDEIDALPEFEGW
jgi:hypothetical protein